MAQLTEQEKKVAMNLRYRYLLNLAVSAKADMKAGPLPSWRLCQIGNLTAILQNGPLVEALLLGVVPDDERCLYSILNVGTA